MLKTEQLAHYLARYRQLPFHRHPELKQYTWQIAEWQQQRMQSIHGNLFQDHTYQQVSQFFLSHFYHFDTLQLLADQMQLIIQQKIKLDRWIPREILETLVQAIELALLTFRLDQHLAYLLLKQQLTVNDQNMMLVVEQSDQYKKRIKQLKLFRRLSIKLDKFAHSFVIRSAFKLAKGKMQQRGFSVIHVYLEQGFKVMRETAHAKQFFIQFSHQEQAFLEYLVNAKPQDLQVYYDPYLAQICQMTDTTPVSVV